MFTALSTHILKFIKKTDFNFIPKMQQTEIYDQNKIYESHYDNYVG